MFDVVNFERNKFSFILFPARAVSRFMLFHFDVMIDIVALNFAPPL